MLGRDKKGQAAPKPAQRAVIHTLDPQGNSSRAGGNYRVRERVLDMGSGLVYDRSITHDLGLTWAEATATVDGLYPLVTVYHVNVAENSVAVEYRGDGAKAFWAELLAKCGLE